MKDRSAAGSGNAQSLSPGDSDQLMPQSDPHPLLRKLRTRLEESGGESVFSAEVAQMLAGLHKSEAWTALGHRTWDALLEAEGIRVEDLGPKLNDESLWAFATALVDAGLSQAAAACVFGVNQRTVSRYLARARRGTGTTLPAASAVDVLKSAAPARPASNREFAESVVGELLREAAAAPPVPASALILALAKVDDVSAYVGEFLSGLGAGSALTARGEGLRRKAVRELEGLAKMLRAADHQPGIRV